ncbi:MAG: hypothetical protein ACOCP8_00055 [archaeon]
MLSKLESYVKYGIYNNILYYPQDKKAIKIYLNHLKELTREIQDINKLNIIRLIKEHKPNIFILSYLFYVIGIQEKDLKLINSSIKSQNDLFVFLCFMEERKKVNKKFINIIYDNNVKYIDNTFHIFFEKFKPSSCLKKTLKNNNKTLNKIYEAMDSGEVDDSIIKTIRDNNVHPAQLGHYMTYYFDINQKIKITSNLMDIYGPIILLPFIDSWFIEEVPSFILNKLYDMLLNITDLVEVYKLLLFYSSLKKNTLCKIIEKIFIDYSPKINNQIDIGIYLASTPKLQYIVDNQEEKYNFLLLNGVNAVLIAAEFDGNIYINDKNVIGDIIQKIKHFKENTAVLNPKIKPKEKYNVLFNDEYVEGFNVLWDVTKETNLTKTEAELTIYGMNTYLLTSFINILKEDFNWVERI